MPRCTLILEQANTKGRGSAFTYHIGSGTQGKVNIVYLAYPHESDPGPMPIAANAMIEGSPNPYHDDRHVLVLDKDGCWLYELDNSFLQKDGSWKADSSVYGT